MTQIEVVDDTHPIPSAAGLSNGLVTVWTSGTRTRASTINDPPHDEAVWAEESDGSGGSMGYTFNLGDELPDSSTAAEKRTAFPVHGETGYATDGNANFATLIQETINWMVPEGGGGGTITLPLLHAIMD